MRKICVIIALCLVSYSVSSGQYYYVNTYKNILISNFEELKADLYLISVDLESKSIVDSIKLANRGFFNSKVPARQYQNNRRILISISESGLGPAKNTGFENTAKVFFSVIEANSRRLLSLRSDSIANARVDGFRQYQNEQGFRFGLRRPAGFSPTFNNGIYTINENYGFRLARPTPNGLDEPGLIERAGSFTSLIKVPFDTTNNLYYGIYDDSQWWLVKLSDNLLTVIDSIQLRPSGGANTIFGFNANRNKFYCLHVNYEMHTNYVDSDSIYKHRSDYSYPPDFWIIDPATLDILDQHSISDYPEGNYPGQDDGLADIVGDYIVYYFFKDDKFYRFDPAMLLIFDTRTNEATWLRVGWR